jgi:hypothetical protein
MTDTIPETVGPDTEAEGWGDTGATYPEYGPLPEARISLNFTPGKAPQLTVRAHTAAELTAALQELEEGNVYNVIGVAHSSMGAQVTIGAGLGQATQVPAPQGAPVAMPLPQSPQAQYPVGPPVPPQGPAPAQWQNAGAPAAVQNNAPEFQQNGWYRLNVPYPKKGQFDGIVAQYGMRKGRPTEGGLVSFNKADKSWYVAPSHAGAFGDFSPMPA